MKIEFEIADDTIIQKLKDEIDLLKEELDMLKCKKVVNKETLRNAYNKYRNTEKGKATISEVKKRYYQRCKAKKLQQQQQQLNTE
jgi:hypothetical protein